PRTSHSARRSALPLTTPATGQDAPPHGWRPLPLKSNAPATDSARRSRGGRLKRFLASSKPAYGPERSLSSNSATTAPPLSPRTPSSPALIAPVSCVHRD